MANVLFVVPPFYGHITATMSVGGELIRRGHNVVWVSLKDVNKSIVPEGGQWLVPKGVEAHRHSIEDILQKQNLGTRIAGIESLDFGLNETLIPFARIMNAVMQDVVDEYQPDCIVHDESALAGAVSAYLNNIPYATTITVPPGFFEPELFFPERQKKLLTEMVGLQKSMGVDQDVSIFNSRNLVISFTSRDVLHPHYGDFQFDAPIEFVGATVDGRPEPEKFDWSRIPGNKNPVVYVSVGTVLDDIRESIFLKVIDAFKDAPFTIIANTDPALFPTWPINFVVEKFCPQLEVISRSDLVITHGGFNTLNEALYFDKPMIALPLAWDQFGNAELIVKNNCGVKLKYRRLRPSDLLAATEEVLKNPIYTQNAKRLGESLRALGGTKKAADLIENLFLERS